MPGGQAAQRFNMAAAPQDAPRHAGQVVRRVLLRRNIAIDAETAQLVADAVQAALQPAARSRRRQRAAVLTRAAGALAPHGAPHPGQSRHRRASAR